MRLDASGRPLVPSRVPETRPTRLGDNFIYLSIVVLVCGVIAISALETGSPVFAPIVRIPVLVGGVVLVLVTLDAVVRVWRSALAWLPVDRGRALFRLVWVLTLVAVLALAIGVIVLVALA